MEDVHISVIYIYGDNLLRVTEKLEPAPADFRQEVGLVLDRSANYHRAGTEMDSYSHITFTQFRIADLI